MRTLLGIQDGDPYNRMICKVDEIEMKPSLGIQDGDPYNRMLCKVENNEMSENYEWKWMSPTL